LRQSKAVVAAVAYLFDRFATAGGQPLEAGVRTRVTTMADDLQAAAEMLVAAEGLAEFISGVSCRTRRSTGPIHRRDWHDD
jgi:hypothetical protein